MAKRRRVRGVYGGAWAKLANIDISQDVLEQLAQCLIKAIIKEARKDFAKRGWTGKDPHGGPDIWDSFEYRISGQRTIEITSTFYGLKELVSGDIPERRMTWMTQQAVGAPTDREKPKEPKKKPGRPVMWMRHPPKSRRQNNPKAPLIVPLKTKEGMVVFRTAPLTFRDAWVHPGIAKFTFMQRGIKKGRRACIEVLKGVLKDEVVSALKENLG